MTKTPEQLRGTPIGEFRELARLIVDSDPVLGIYAACEWDDLHDDGKEWIAAIVRETMATVAEGRS